MAGINPKESATKIVKRCVCQTCSAKVKLISSIRSESVKVKTETTEIEDRKLKQHREVENEELDLEELDQLSLFYAEHDDPEKDPDFAPKTPKKSNKRLIKKPKVIPPSVTITKEAPRDLVDTNLYFSCQICPNKTENFRNAESLRLHFVDVHGYKKEKKDTSNLKHGVSIQCHHCSIEFSSQYDYISHVFSCDHSAAIKPGTTRILVSTKSFSCETCQRTFRRKATLKSHKINCYYLNPENGSNQTECKICGKDILPSRMAAHRSFEHVCRICDDQFIFANRKEKCQHLEIVHKWWTKGKVKKALGEVPCPKEGCLQKFPRGSKRLKSHIKRDHEDSTVPKRLYECKECHALLKNITCLRSHKETMHGSNEDRTKCPYCDFSVGKWRKHSLYR